MTMEEFITTIRMKKFFPTAMINNISIVKADLITIDDIMLFSVKNDISAGFFNLIKTLYEKILSSSLQINHLQKESTRLMMKS